MKRVQETQEMSKMLKMSQLKDPYEWKKEQKQKIHEKLIVLEKAQK